MNRREFTGHLVAGAAAVATIGTMEACTPPNWINTIIADLPTVLNIVTTIASIVEAATGVISPATAAIIAAAITAVQVAIPLIQKLVADYQANPTASIVANIKTALIDVQSQLGAILDAAHVLNPALRATITTAIGLAIGVLTAILSLLPSSTVSLAAKVAKVKAQSGWASDPTKASNITNQFNSFLTDNGYGKYVK
jgi:hypothetical protein